MGFWNKGRIRQLGILVVPIALTLVLSAAWTALADASEHHPLAAGQVQPQADATSTATLVVPPTVPSVSAEGAESAELGSMDAATPTVTSTPTSPPPADPPESSSPVNVIVNGGFEEGFVEGQGVGLGWGRFQNGNVFAGWYDDTWFKVVYEGEHAQLLELKDAREQDRYVGIFQTVSVVPHAEYDLTLHGLVRSDSGSPDLSDYGYRMQYGIDYNGGTNWESVDIEWVELLWDEQPREDPSGENVYRMEAFTTKINSETDQLTLFVRAWKKWPDGGEGNYDIDGVSLVGPQPGGAAQPAATAEPGIMPETGDVFTFAENQMVVVASAVLLVVLAGGAVWGLARRRRT